MTACSTSQTIVSDCPKCPDSADLKIQYKYVCLNGNKTIVESPDQCYVTPAKLVVTQINIMNDSSKILITGEVYNNGTTFWQGNYQMSAALYYKGKVQSVQNYGSPTSTIFGGQTKAFQFTFSKMDYDDYKVYLG